jgi:hypothetical protein
MVLKGEVCEPLPPSGEAASTDQIAAAAPEANMIDNESRRVKTKHKRFTV